MSAWKPGDLASFLVFGERITAIRTDKGTWNAYAPRERSWVDRDWDGKFDQQRLVVIDPASNPHRKGTAEWADWIEEQYLAQIQPPKPEEPTGLAGLVRYDGVEWIGLGEHRWLEVPSDVHVEPRRWRWEDFPNEVEVVREGWSE